MYNNVFWVVDKIYYIVQFSRINQLDARACVFRLAAYVIYKHIIHNTGRWCEPPRCHQLYCQNKTFGPVSRGSGTVESSLLLLLSDQMIIIITWDPVQAARESGYLVCVCVCVMCTKYIYIYIYGCVCVCVCINSAAAHVRRRHTSAMILV